MIARARDRRSSAATPQGIQALPAQGPPRGLHVLQNSPTRGIFSESRRHRPADAVGADEARRAPGPSGPCSPASRPPSSSPPARQAARVPRGAGQGQGAQRVNMAQRQARAQGPDIPAAMRLPGQLGRRRAGWAAPRRRRPSIRQLPVQQCRRGHVPSSHPFCQPR